MELVRKTNRLCIRPFAEDDFLAWQSAYSQMSVEKQNPWDLARQDLEFLTEERFELGLSSRDQGMEEGTSCELGVFLQNGRLVGVVNLMEIIRGHFQSAFLGYRIFNNFWGKGYATEACRAMIDIGFNDYRLHRLEAAISPENAASLAVIKKLGFRYEGLSKKRILVQGEWADMEVHALTTEDIDKEWQL